MMDGQNFGAKQHPEGRTLEHRVWGVRLAPGLSAPFQIRRSSTAMFFYFVREKRCA
jgi:hypothetical protein